MQKRCVPSDWKLSNFYRSATPSGRRGLQASGLWVRSVLFCTHDRADANRHADTADRADATDRADVIFYFTD